MQTANANFVDLVPRDVSLAIFSHLDPLSLLKVAQVNKQWQAISLDRAVWRRVCVRELNLINNDPFLSQPTQWRALQERVEALLFEAATEEIKKLATSLDNELLQLYALYKQATVGDNTGAQPWAVQIEARAKWEAWNKHKGMSKRTAKKQYVKLAHCSVINNPTVNQ